MRYQHLLVPLLAGSLLPAQTKSLVFTQRFDCQSLDVANERAGGSLTKIREFDLAVATPGPNAIARSWIPTTSHAAAWGDGHGDGNYARFLGWKASSGEFFNFAGPFVKHADRGKNDPRLFFWTIRDSAVNKVFKVFTAGGTQTVQIKPGDFFRWGSNGSVELFLTQALIQKAKGPASGIEAPGAGCVCQDAQGNLYYSPAQGGHWVSGNLGPVPIFCNDGGIVMIDAADITYDAQGNVMDIAAGKAHILFEEVTAGPNGQPHVRTMVTNAGAWNNTGAAQLITTTKMVGIDIDPNGGTLTSSFPVGTTFPTVPNLIFAWDSGTWAGTIFSTANNAASQPGSVAIINGVKCGSDVASVPATGSWLGLKQDTVNFLPTVMGFAVVDGAPAPFSADAPNDGVIQQADAGIFVDMHAGAFTPVFLFLAPGPLAPGLFQYSADVGTNPLLSADSWKQLYTTSSLTVLTIGVANAAGYVTWQAPNIWSAPLVGISVVFQGCKQASPTQVALSNPVQMQFR